METYNKGTQTRASKANGKKQITEYNTFPKVMVKFNSMYTSISYNEFKILRLKLGKKYSMKRSKLSLFD